MIFNFLFLLYPMSKQQNDETDNRIYSRYIPQQSLQPYLDIKPVSTTRCSVFPIVDTRPTMTYDFPIYNVGMFNPGNRKGPWSGFSSRVEDESVLRNQVFPLQKSNTANTYVPSSGSDLYVPLMNEHTGSAQGHPLLSETYVPPPAILPKPKDPLLFGNHTRYQLE